MIKPGFILTARIQRQNTRRSMRKSGDAVFTNVYTRRFPKNYRDYT